MAINKNAVVKRAAELQISKPGRRELDAADFHEAMSCLALAIVELALKQDDPRFEAVDFLNRMAMFERKRQAKEERARKRAEREAKKALIHVDASVADLSQANTLATQQRTIKPAPKVGTIPREKARKAVETVTARRRGR